jgi:hypothetical protein
MAEGAGDEGGHTDVGTVAVCCLDREARHRQLADIEILAAKCAEEDFFRRQIHEDRIDAVDLDSPIHERTNSVVVADGHRQLELRHRPSFKSSRTCYKA